MLTAYFSPTPSQKAPLKMPVVRPGSSGSTVRILQQLLNFKGFKLEVNGEFNSHTQDAVKEFQRIKGLPIEGIVDSQTWYHLSLGLLPVES
ncbi:MAG: hypothetical protein Fur006_56830 [Coleofasciculaceae cyanobacterium]